MELDEPLSLDTIPTELLCHIFIFLDPIDWLRFSYVSKRWAQLLLRNDLLWNSVSKWYPTMKRHPIYKQTWSKLTQDQQKEFLSKMLKRIPNIQSLNFQMVPLSVIPWDILEKKRMQLQELQFSRVHEIPDVMLKLFSPTLTKLELCSSNHLILASISAFCHSLKILRVGINQRRNAVVSLTFISYVFSRLPNLEEADLTNLELTQFITASAPKLKILKLSVCEMNGRFLNSLGTMCPRLYWLEMPFCNLQELTATTFLSFANLDSFFVTMSELNANELFTSVLPISKKLCTLDVAGTSMSSSHSNLQQLMLNCENLINLKIWNLELDNAFLLKLKNEFQKLTPNQPQQQQAQETQSQSQTFNTKMLHLALSRVEAENYKGVNLCNDVGIQCLPFIWPNLVSLNVSGMVLTDDAIRSICQLKNLNYLNISGISGLTVHSYVEIGKNLSNLSQLVIGWKTFFDKDSLDFIISNCPKISLIIADSNPNMTKNLALYLYSLKPSLRIVCNDLELYSE